MNNLSQKGDYASSCLFFTKDNWVGTTIIPLLNANNYTITLTGIVMFGDGSEADISGWDIKKYKNGFHMQKNNSDSVYYFGTLHPNKLFAIHYTVS